MDLITNQMQLEEMFKYRNQGLSILNQKDDALEIVKLAKYHGLGEPNPDETLEQYSLRISTKLLTSIKKARKQMVKNPKLEVKPDADFQPTPFYLTFKKKYWEMKKNGKVVTVAGKKLIGIEDELSINFYAGVPETSAEFDAVVETPFISMEKFTTKTNKQGGSFFKGSNPWLLQERKVLAFQRGKKCYNLVSVADVISC